MLIKQNTVQYHEGLVMSKRINAAAFLECSAKTREGVKDVFEAATRASLKKINKQMRRCFIL